MATSSLGTTPWGTTPAGLTPVGSTPDPEKYAEFEEEGEFLSSDFLSVDQIANLLAEDIGADAIQEKLGKFLNLKHLHTHLKDAILLDYYVSGFLWAKEMDFSILQNSKFMSLLNMLLHNLSMLHMSLEESIKWLGEVMAELGPHPSPLENEEWNTFDVKQSNAIIDYFKNSLFQHYKLYEFLFFSPREEIVIGTKQVIEVVRPIGYHFPDPLEEGISFDNYSTFIEPASTLETDVKAEEQVPEESQTESDTSEEDPLVGFTIEDVKSALGQVTDDVLLGIQTEINEKLQIQEDAFNERIEKLKKA
ncbi:ciliary-associated calcium-binding coiled-coil protein 1 [Perognathus longimembris pacificus]|uniref:ciliary-associated calcium-binding coiled-coil protein 1 n=1 Tax=Perognathus longimembris pacificus TaxID=214514 RepID=UPI002019DAEF|nr:ciliary-associated calcium-binding coiled-coil protein 1 [Perognathus longimembris pacificus]